MCNKERAVSFFEIGRNFLTMSHLSSVQILENWNENNGYSVENVALPVLFNFYQGIELMLKSVIQTHLDIGNIHQLKTLIKKANRNTIIPVEFIQKIREYVTDKPEYSIMRHFIKSNNEKLGDKTMSIDNWYTALKYPDPKVEEAHKAFIHSDLKMKTDESKEFWEALSKDSLEIIELTREYLMKNNITV